jgi:hypothetical protein
MKTMKAVLVGFLVVMTFVPSAVARTRHHVPALGAPTIFSDFFSDGPTGDVGGMQVILLGGQSGWAAVTTASGDFNAPVLVRVTYHGDQIEFTLPATESGGASGTFTGKISPAGLTLRSGESQAEFLRRQPTACYE